VRVMKLLIWPALVFLILGSAQAYVFDSMDVSSKARGMAGAWVASADDASAIFYNPACLLEAESRNIYATFLQPNSQSFEMLGFFAYSMPLGKAQSVGVSFRGFGVEYKDVDLMDEWTMSIGYAVSLMKDIHSSLSIGGTANVYSLSFASAGSYDLGSERTYGFDVGILGNLRDRTRIGFFLKNINEPSLGKVNREALPQWLTAGISYRPYYGVVTELDVRSVRGEDVEMHMGMQFAVTDFLDIRFGFQTEPSSLTGGFTVGVARANLDYAYSSHSVLPGTHHVALRAIF
jgi:long-subunit fatty acid transport protein